jgi:hypothetical protein
MTDENSLVLLSLYLSISILLGSKYLVTYMLVNSNLVRFGTIIFGNQSEDILASLASIW